MLCIWLEHQVGCKKCKYAKYKSISSALAKQLSTEFEEARVAGVLDIG